MRKAPDDIGRPGRFEPFGAYAAYGLVLLVLLGAIFALGAAIGGALQEAGALLLQ